MVEEGDGFSYFHERTVTNAGMTGVFSESGWYGTLYISHTISLFLYVIYHQKHYIDFNISCHF